MRKRDIVIVLSSLFLYMGLLALGYLYYQSKQMPVPENLNRVVVTLERTMCLGTCPDYKLIIKGDGTVIYKGREFVKIKGIRKVKISVSKVKQLISEFRKANYFAMRNKYTAYYVTDMPSAITSITINGKTKKVEHYFGDQSAPKALVNLENKIDEIVNSNQWIKQKHEM